MTKQPKHTLTRDKFSSPLSFFLLRYPPKKSLVFKKRNEASKKKSQKPEKKSTTFAKIKTKKKAAASRFTHPIPQTPPLPPLTFFRHIPSISVHRQPICLFFCSQTDLSRKEKEKDILRQIRPRRRGREESKAFLARPRPTRREMPNAPQSLFLRRRRRQRCFRIKRR